MKERNAAADALRDERDSIKPRLRQLRQEIKEYERGIYRHAWNERHFADYREQIDYLVDEACARYRQILDLEVRARTIGGEIFKLEHPSDDIDRRTRAYRTPRGPRKPYKTRRGKVVLPPPTN